MQDINKNNPIVSGVDDQDCSDYPGNPCPTTYPECLQANIQYCERSCGLCWNKGLVAIWWSSESNERYGIKRLNAIYDFKKIFFGGGDYIGFICLAKLEGTLDVLNLQELQLRTL